MNSMENKDNQEEQVSEQQIAKIIEDNIILKPNSDQEFTLYKHLTAAKEINKLWQSKYRKLEEELDVERKCFMEQTKVLYEIKDENGKLEEDLINTRAGWKKEHDLRQVYQLRIEKLEEENKKLKFMIENGLGWEDMKNDITYPRS